MNIDILELPDFVPCESGKLFNLLVLAGYDYGDLVYTLQAFSTWSGIRFHMVLCALAGSFVEGANVRFDDPYCLVQISELVEESYDFRIL